MTTSCSWHSHSAPLPKRDIKVTLAFAVYWTELLAAPSLRHPRARRAASTSRPLHDRGHRGQDRIHIAAGAQPEHGATVIEQVELDVASAPHELLLALRLAPG